MAAQLDSCQKVINIDNLYSAFCGIKSCKSSIYEKAKDKPHKFTQIFIRIYKGIVSNHNKPSTNDSQNNSSPSENPFDRITNFMFKNNKQQFVEIGHGFLLVIYSEFKNEYNKTQAHQESLSYYMLKLFLHCHMPAAEYSTMFEPTLTNFCNHLSRNLKDKDLWKKVAKLFVFIDNHQDQVNLISNPDSGKMSDRLIKICKKDLLSRIATKEEMLVILRHETRLTPKFKEAFSSKLHLIYGLNSDSLSEISQTTPELTDRSTTSSSSPNRSGKRKESTITDSRASKVKVPGWFSLRSAQSTLNPFLNQQPPANNGPITLPSVQDIISNLGSQEFSSPLIAPPTLYPSQTVRRRTSRLSTMDTLDSWLGILGLPGNKK